MVIVLRSTILSIACLFATVALNAQEGQEALDTLYGSKRDVVAADVMSIANGKVHVKRPSDRPGRTLVIPFSDVDAIRFADGFRLDFQGGELIRDNVLSAPSYDESLLHVKAEGCWR